MLLGASAAEAKSVTFGHRIDHEPNTASPCIDDGSDTPDLSITCTRIPVDEDRRRRRAGRHDGAYNGRIKKFRIRAVQPGTGHVPRRPHARGLRQGRRHRPYTFNVGGPWSRRRGPRGRPVETFKANVKVKKGDYVGITSSVAPALYCSHGGDNQLLFTPALGSAFAARAPDTDSCELLVQASMKRKR